MTQTEAFLPYIDNWAVCDTMSPKVFVKHKPELIEKIREWIPSDHTYTCRFGMGMLMMHFLDEDFIPEYLELPAAVHSDEYYVNMMIAWFFATALAKQWDASLPYLEGGRLDIWTHNKTIQKSVESFRITREQKEYLKGLKRRVCNPNQVLPPPDIYNGRISRKEMSRSDGMAEKHSEYCSGDRQKHKGAK